jgi:outer membrane protein OmpA-like peptidoglycan-associated protein
MASGGINAQINLGKKVADQVKNRTEQKTDQAIDKGLDEIEKGVENPQGEDQQKQQPSTTTDKKEQQKPAEQPAQPQTEPAKTETAPQEQTALQTYSKYDFIPGSTVIFFDDFSQDAVGDFPVQWNTNGSGEVVTSNLFTGHWMKFSGQYCVWTDALLDLPDNFTIEFDIIPIRNDENNMEGYIMRLFQAKNARAWDGGSAPGYGGFKFVVEYFGRPSYSTWFIKSDCGPTALSGTKDDDAFKQKVDQLYHIAIWVQKSRIRLYQNETKLIDLPKAFQTGCVKLDRLRFEYGSAMISNVRVAIGAPDTRNKLITEGKLVTYGIYFDVNKDIVKPESYGTLKEIATVLTENPDVRIKIIGHTDSDGADAANLDLSKRRAASVKNELSKNFGIDASRLEPDGKGETEPVAPNDTPANKALNRRVEFIKL